MKRILLGIAVCGLVTSLSANAASPTNITFLGSLSATPSIDDTRADVTGCADFNGSWKGTCTSAEGKKVEESFTIKQQGCELVQVEAHKNTMFIPIGGVFSLGGAIAGTPAVSFGMDLNSNWNKEKSVLSLYVMAGGKKLAIDEKGHGFFVKENVRLVNGKLAVDIYAIGSEHKSVSYCEFNKQS